MRLSLHKNLRNIVLHTVNRCISLGLLHIFWRFSDINKIFILKMHSITITVHNRRGKNFEKKLEVENILDYVQFLYFRMKRHGGQGAVVEYDLLWNC
jgi:hypothetical protein